MNEKDDDWFDGYDDFVKTLDDGTTSGGNNSRGGGGGGGDRRQEYGRGGRGGQASFGGNGGGYGGHDYSRHPNDTDSVDVAAVNAMLTDRLECRKRGEFDQADAIRDALRDEFGVSVWDKERTWTTNPGNPRGGGDRGGRGGRDREGRGGGRGGGRERGGRGGRSRPQQDFGPNGHDYEMTGEIDPAVCSLSEPEIHQMIAERLQHKLTRNFRDADDIQVQLQNAGVTVHDGAKQWRADGGEISGGGNQFGGREKRMTVYRFRARFGNDGLTDEELAEIADQITLRAEAKRDRNYNAADEIKDYLGERYNISIDDRNGEYYVRSDSYVPSASSDEFGDASVQQEVEAMVAERWEAKKMRDFDVADSIRDDLRENYSVSIDDRRKEFTYTAPNDYYNRADAPPEVSFEEDEISYEREEEDEDEDIEVPALMEDGEREDLESLTLPVLKERLRAVGLPVSGRKAELIERLNSMSP